MIWLIRLIRSKLVSKQKYKYVGYLRTLEKKLTKKSNYQGFPNTLNK